MAVAVTMAAPAVSDDEPPPCLYLPTLVELLMRDQPPSRALCSFLAMFWFWSDWEAEEKELLLGAVLLGLLRFLKDRMACLVLDLLSCLSCHGGTKGDKPPVTMSFSFWVGVWGWSPQPPAGFFRSVVGGVMERALDRTVHVLPGVAVFDLPISCLC